MNLKWPSKRVGDVPGICLWRGITWTFDVLRQMWVPGDPEFREITEQFCSDLNWWEKHGGLEKVPNPKQIVLPPMRPEIEMWANSHRKWLGLFT